jgi:hypothetical protein
MELFNDTWAFRFLTLQWEKQCFCLLMFFCA